MLEKISRGNQIIIYTAVFVLVFIFILYFFRQAEITQSSIGQLGTEVRRPAAGANNVPMNIDFDLLTSSKFLSLKSQAAPVQNFSSGKRDPFEP
jgi:hypothetical protein